VYEERGGEKQIPSNAPSRCVRSRVQRVNGAGQLGIGGRPILRRMGGVARREAGIPLQRTGAKQKGRTLGGVGLSLNKGGVVNLQRGKGDRLGGPIHTRKGREHYLNR